MPASTISIFCWAVNVRYLRCSLIERLLSLSGPCSKPRRTRSPPRRYAPRLRSRPAPTQSAICQHTRREQDDARAQPGVAAELGRRGEPLDVADLRGDRKRVDPAEPGRGDQQRDVAMIGALVLELDGQPGDLQLEVIDQLQAGVDIAPPRVRDRQPVEQLAAGQAEQI